MAPASKKMMSSQTSATSSSTITSLFFRSRSHSKENKPSSMSNYSSNESNSNDFSTASEDTEEINCPFDTSDENSDSVQFQRNHSNVNKSESMETDNSKQHISTEEINGDNNHDDVDDEIDVKVKCDNSSLATTPTTPSRPNTPTTIVNFEICCLLAEGSPTCFVSNFSSMIELYEKIAECFDISAKEIMYCTLNTPKIDMEQVLCGQICLNDIVFVHRKGRRKEVEVRKTEPFLGLTIADNGNGCSYIKKIKPNSTASRVPFIKVGDHIESIMGHSMVGHRHFEVARFLKSIDLNEIFTINLVEPVASNIQLRMATAVKSPMITGLTDAYATIKPCSTKNSFKLRHNPSLRSEYESNNNIDEEEISHIKLTTTASTNTRSDNSTDPLFQTGLYYINKQLEKYLGINDDELAGELWMMATTVTVCQHQQQTTINNADAKQKRKPLIIKHRACNNKKLPRNNPHEFAQNIKNSDLNDFKFTDDFIFDIWAIVNDVCNGRLQLLTTKATIHHQNGADHKLEQQQQQTPSQDNKDGQQQDKAC